jgi:hypothetical protein
MPSYVPIYGSIQAFIDGYTDIGEGGMGNSFAHAVNCANAIKIAKPLILRILLIRRENE